MKRYIITLKKKERDALLEMTKGGQHSSKRIIHAMILLNCDEGKYSEKVKNEDIAKVLKIGMRTIDRIKKKFIEEGFEIALEGKPTTRVYEKEASIKTHLIQLSQSEAPEGFSKWSLRLLAEKMVENKYAESISHETVRNILKNEINSRKGGKR